MATTWLESRNQAAKAASTAIDPIAEAIMAEWGMTFSEIKSNGKEPDFDREIILRICDDKFADKSVKDAFFTSMSFTGENYGKIWFEFSEEQRMIIALKESKLFW